jgi:glutamate synthase (NADPH/NADH) large chain
MAFIYDAADEFPHRVNPETVTWQRIATPHWAGVLKALIEEHVRETQSRFAEQILVDWEFEARRFWQVVPKEMLQRLPQPLGLEEKRAATGDDD